MKWIAAFSQTGTEICDLIDAGFRPDLVVTNNFNTNSWNPRLLTHQFNLPLSMYMSRDKNVMWSTLKEFNPQYITLHGYLQIIPGEYCRDLTIINGHPGDVIMYPELSGKDPQAKAIELGLESTGVIIHRATEVVDSGEVLAYKKHSIEKGTTTEQLTKELKSLQLSMWKEVLGDLL